MSTPKNTSSRQTSAAKPAAPRPKKVEPITISIADCINRLVKIKPGVETFISGKGITQNMRDSELYISRVNGNGTAVIAYSESLIDIDSVFLKDLEILDDQRTFHDEVQECPNISIRIFGVPERIDWIKANQKRLGIPDELIFIDKNHEGIIPTAKRAWEYPTDKPYVLVLQDDVELCDNFMHYVNVIVETQPDSLISLYSTQFSKQSSVSRIPAKSPYVATDLLTAQGLIMKSEWIEPCLASWKPNIKGDDTNIALWAKENNIRILTILPTIMQHIGDISVFDKSRSMGRSEFYKKNPINVHWDCDYVTQYTDIVGG